jgi:hypothetical protein
MAVFLVNNADVQASRKSAMSASFLDYCASTILYLYGDQNPCVSDCVSVKKLLEKQEISGQASERAHAKKNETTGLFLTL